MPDGGSRGRLIPEDPAVIEERLLSEIQRRRECRTSFQAYATEITALVDQAPAAHHRLLISELEAVDRGDNDRLMVFMPPGHAKTFYSSILFPAWFLRIAGRNVIGASYNSEFAENDVSSPILRLIQENGPVLDYGLRTDNRKIWRTTNRGVYRAAGATSGITGRRADLFVIDDPIKGRIQADSETYRNQVWNWYRAEVITRLKPGARVILILTRWHEDDLAGRLLEAEKAGADKWRVIKLPAIAETDDDPLGRSKGDALWPEWEDVEHLQRKRASVGEREWAALFQQRPAPLEGALFKIAAIGVVPARPAGGVSVRAWDLAATKQVGTANPDWTVGLLLNRSPEGRYTVCDVVRVRGGPDDVRAAIVNTAAVDGEAIQISLPQDPGQAGKVQVLDLTRALTGYRVGSSPETGDKSTRAAPVASQANVGNLSIVKSDIWNRVFLDELGGFPSAAKDDQVDALSRAFSVIGLARGPMKIDPLVMAASRRARR
jgi:predicted phage terminase large subunit-like protein